MPWYTIPATILIEVEAENDKEAEAKARNLLLKRVEGCEFGHSKNDRAQVSRGNSELEEKTGWDKTDDNGETIDMFDEDGIDLETGEPDETQ